MKLLQLNVTANWGSTGKIAEGIGQAAMARGWESIIAYGRYANSSESRLIKVGGKLDVYAHYLRNRMFDGEGLGSRRATKALLSQIDALQPDIIHLHNIHDHWLNYPALFDYLATIPTPIVWTFHDCWAFTGHCAHFENIGCQKWRKSCEACLQKRKGSLDCSARNFLLKKEKFQKVVDRLHIVGVSDWLARHVRDSFLSGADIRTIHNGVDTNVFDPIGITKKHGILGVSNVWPEYKGLKDFIQLREILPKDIEITVVGLEKNQIANLPQGIRRLSRTASLDELVRLYNEASVFVNPSKNESFPTVNIEALACGTPVVTYRTGGSPEAVDDNTGLVVEKGDVKGLANAVMQAIDNPDRFSPPLCRQRALEHFDKNTQFQKYIDLYESLLIKHSL